MKFYKEIDQYQHYYWNKIYIFRINAIYCDFLSTIFLENGRHSNIKNAAYIGKYNKKYYLHSKFYGDKYNFNKQSWRRFVKLQAFL
jgi:hypothetical protein